MVILIGAREFFAHREASKSKQQDRDTALRCPPLPVRDADPFALGVTPSEIADQYRGASKRPPYVTRDIDVELDRLLRDNPFVAIVGPSKAGKSRTAFEAVSRIYPNRLLVAPELPTLQREDMSRSIADYVASSTTEIVIWLDDLQEFLRTRSLASHDMNSWRSEFPRVVVVATIRDSELSTLRASQSVGVNVERLIDLAKLVPLPPLFSEGEMADAKTVYPSEDFRDGIGVHMVAGQQLVERLVSARGDHPLGFAVTAAAIDRKRAGVRGPASPNELAGLGREYFEQLRPRSDYDPRLAEQAVEWAADPVIQDIGLLLSKDEGRYEPFDYVIAYRDGEVGGGIGASSIPLATWNALVSQHSGWTLRSIGFSAMAHEEPSVAKRAFSRLMGDPDAHVAAHGIFDLADVHWHLGEVKEASKLYRDACDCGYDCVTAKAYYCYAVSIPGGDEDTEPWYRKALEFPKSPTYPKALVNLGLLLRSKSGVRNRRFDGGVRFGKTDRTKLTERDHELEAEAQKLFEEAVDSHDAEARANGGNALGVLFASRGELAAAEEALRKGAEAGNEHARAWRIDVIGRDAERRPEAWILLADAEAEAVSGEGMAYLNFVAARLAEREGDAVEVRRRLEHLLDEQSSYWEQAAVSLSGIYMETEGDDMKARALLQRVADANGFHAEEARKRLERLSKR
ncbi:MAG: hypothetical protein ABW065_04435 [Solirubrobacterales bacterium]